MASVAKINYFIAIFIFSAGVLVHCEDEFDYYLYEVDNAPVSLESWRPSFKHLEKRQVEKDQSKVALMNKETKSQLDLNLENSSQPKLLESNVSSKLGVSDGGTVVSELDANFNETLPTVDYEGLSVNISKVLQDHHKYYNSSLFVNAEEGMRYWVDLDSVDPEKVVTHQMLSHSHRRAATIQLSFDFPFYGHMVRNVTIATGGFLYTGDYVHSWLAATQYIAPLMANFDTSLSNDSTIKYWDNGTALTVQWDRVVLQDRKNAGNFTFQAVLKNNGDVIFVYKNLPISVTSIADEAHPVKVGLSDAYVIERTIFFMRRKTIYEYHQVNMKKDELTNGSAIYFSALPSCVSLTDCYSCISNTIQFECVWCSRVGRCSDGTDRHRQDWIIKECDKNYIDQFGNCAANATSVPTSTATPATTKPPSASSREGPAYPSSNVPNAEITTVQVVTVVSKPVTSTSNPLTAENGASFTDSYRESDANETKDHAEGGTSTSTVIGILFFMVLVLGVGGWIFYAYRNPHTPSGQFLIRYRPNNWRWRSGEAHYTAAAIHM